MAKAQRFKGTGTIYTVIGQRTGTDQKLAVGMEYHSFYSHAGKGGGALIRFAAIGSESFEKFKAFNIRGNFNFREMDEMGETTGKVVPGVYLNKTAAPLYQPAPSKSMLLEADKKFGTSAMLAAWLQDLAAKDGFTITIDDLVGFVRDSLVGPINIEDAKLILDVSQIEMKAGIVSHQKWLPHTKSDIEEDFDGSDDSGDDEDELVN